MNYQHNHKVIKVLDLFLDANKLFTVFVFLFVSATLCGQTKTIVIDAGHGGKDPGAMGKHSKEKNITLAIALKVGNYIEENMDSVKVIYTRKTDVFVRLEDRAKMANSAGADLFVSIHANAIANTRVSGTETYVMGLHKTDDNLKLAVTENSSIFYEKHYKTSYSGYNPQSPETYIVMNLFQSVYQQKSIQLAEKVQEQFRTRAGRRDKGVKQAGFLVLWQTTMPSVLVEVGFVSNLAEERFLSEDYGQSIIASAIYRAVKEYLLENEK